MRNVKIWTLFLSTIIIESIRYYVYLGAAIFIIIIIIIIIIFQASLDQPANIPVVLSAPCMLYQTSVGGCQQELSLPLGMVVNAVFKNQVILKNN